MNYNVPSQYQINTIKKSTMKTLNCYQKKDVILALFDCLNKKLIVDANFWAAELFASGFYLTLWDTIFKFYFQSIHIINPNFIDYLNQKYLLFCRIKKLYGGNLKNLPNNQELRNHFAEMITLLCLSKTTPVSIPTSVSNCEEDIGMIQKTEQIIEIIAPYVSTSSTLHKQFQSFIINYYCDNLNNCLYLIHWFLQDNQHTINPFDEFKVPSSIAQKSLWLLWKFLLLQSQTSKETTENPIDTIELFELLIQIFLLIYKRKDIETCVFILFFIILMIRHPYRLDWSQTLDVTNHQLIKNCIEINHIYKNLQIFHEKLAKSAVTEIDKKESHGTKKISKKKKKILDKHKFYQNEKNLDFLEVINDSDILIQNIEVNQQTKKFENVDQHKGHGHGHGHTGQEDLEDELVITIPTQKSKKRHI